MGDDLKTRYPPDRHEDGLLLASTIGLEYPVRAKSATAKSDELAIKCVATIGNAYWKSVVQKTRLRRQGRMLESRSSANQGGYFPSLYCNDFQFPVELIAFPTFHSQELHRVVGGGAEKHRNQTKQPIFAFVNQEGKRDWGK